MRWVCVSLLILIVAGCALSRPAIIAKGYENDKIVSEIKVIGEAGSIEPIQFNSNTWSASTGKQQGFDQALSSMSQYSNWLGGGLIGLGIISVIVRMWIPLIPFTASILLVASGAGVMYLPVLLDRYGTYLLLGLAGIGYLWFHGYMDNKKLEDEIPKRIKRADAKGD